MMPKPLTRTIQFAIALALPLALLVANVQFLMHMRFLRYEYNKSGFPSDTAIPPGGYPLSQVERLELARAAMQSIIGPEGMRALEEARFRETGEPAFNGREIRHMRDVRILFQRVRIIFWGGLVLLFGGGLLLIWRASGAGKRGQALTRPLLTSVGVTLTLAIGLGLYILLNFSSFFTQFHHLFFEGDTWLFRQDDTLIRLFPTPFWFDAATFIAVLTVAELLLIALAAWWWDRKLTNQIGADPLSEALDGR